MHKKTLFFLSLILSFLSLSASAQWLTEGVIKVQNGKIVESGVLADSKGKIYLEFLKDQTVANKADKTAFSGELLPPVIIESPIKAPRARMREISSFDLITSDDSDINFIDSRSLIRSRNRLRVSLSEETLKNDSGVLLLTRMFLNENISRPALWHLVDPKNQDHQKRWKRIGGKLENSPEPDVKIFSATIFASGMYTIWDEDPLPESTPYWTDPVNIEPALVSPTPSVEPRPADPEPEATKTSAEDSEVQTNSDDSPRPRSSASKSSSDTNTFDASTEVPAVDDSFSFKNFSFNDEGKTIFSGLEVPSIPDTGNSKVDTVIPAIIENTKNQLNKDLAAGSNLIKTTLGETIGDTTEIRSSAGSFSDSFLDTIEKETQFIDLQDYPEGTELLPEAGNKTQFNFPWAFLVLLLSIGGSIYFASSRRY